ncbi:endoglucanase V-like protein [Phanerochaete sordida]|uniref:Endoglucanase V-like protein n=1 Tax=Phanerochaete sordida TaxID=48140 RepID=A0A9P3LKZ2_9APHY|nr:endoglucanase V-like protein [Phanerochaete sordida]
MTLPAHCHPAMFKHIIAKFLLTALVAGDLVAPSNTSKRATGGYIQNPSGSASFTMFSGCGAPACGITATGFTAAMNQLSFGSAPGLGAGDACGRCFALTGTHDPFSPSFTGPFHSVVVKVTDLCPVQGNAEWCGQTESHPTNQHGEGVHFDICEDTGGAAAFFPSGHGALTGTYSEVSCSEWTGSDGSPQFNGACLAGEHAGFWPSVGCGNKGTAPS